MTQPQQYDPEATVWEAVADLEKKGFTKREIYDSLHEVAAPVLTESEGRQ